MSRGRHAKPSPVTRATAAAIPAVMAAGTIAAVAASPAASAAHVAASSAAHYAVADVAVARLSGDALRTAAARAPAYRSYTVVTGDTLSGIAFTHLGDAARWHAIYALNRKVIGGNPDLILPGQVLRLPGSAAAPAVTAPPPPVRHHHGHHHAAASYSPAGSAFLTIYKYLREDGYTPAAAAGIVACIAGESGGNPESVGSGGFGLIGWTGNTIGLPAGYSWPTGNYGYDMGEQLQGLVGYINALGSRGDLNAYTSPGSAAWHFSESYEKPAVTGSDIQAWVGEQLYAQG